MMFLAEKLDERHEQLKLEYKDLHEKNLEVSYSYLPIDGTCISKC